MSSFLGHSLTAVAIYTLDSGPKRRGSLLWLSWLIVVAVAPDVDYLFPFLRPKGLRVTHSLVGCLLLPLLTIGFLNGPSIPPAQLKIMGRQVILASLSHLVMDLLVGVGALPLFYPVSSYPCKLPFGILPSAGKVALDNYFFYRNLLIEMGVIIPLYGALYLLFKSQTSSKGLFVILGFISAGCMAWAFSLNR